MKPEISPNTVDNLPLANPAHIAPAQAAPVPDIVIRDIHLPDAISWWPLAPGWWGLLALIVIAIVLFWYLRRRKAALKNKLPSIHSQVMLELKTVYQIEDDGLFLQALSELLKRVAITQYGKKVSGLTGERWLKFLDSKWDKNTFVKGQGRVLIDLPYRKDPQSDRKKLIKVVKSWLESHV